MAKLPGAIAILMSVFDEYAGKDGDGKTMTKAELAEMLHKELPGAGGKAEADQFFCMLDNDKSNSIDFKEYVLFVATLAMIIKG